MKENKTTRRNFLKIAGLTLGASAAACYGLGKLATIAPQITYPEATALPGEPMNKILVTYASKAGSTSEVAQAIAQTLGENGTSSDVLQLKHVKDLGAYQAIVLGSAIRMGRWLPEALNFVKKYQATLQRVPTAFFTVCLTMKDNTAENRSKVEEYMQPVLAVHRPASLGLFGGKMDYGRLSFADSTIVRLMKIGEGDYRNWQVIQTWAQEIQPALTS